MFDHLVRRFLNNIIEPKPTVHTAPKKIVYFCLAFTGSHLTFDLPFAPLHASLLSFLVRIKSPGLGDLVLYIFIEV